MGVFIRIIIDIYAFCAKMYSDMQRLSGNQAVQIAFSEEETVKASGKDPASHFLRCPG